MTFIDELERQYSRTWLEGLDAIEQDYPEWIIDLFEEELQAIEEEINVWLVS